VTATARTTVTMSSLASAGTVSFTLHGANNASATVTAQITDKNDLSALANAINQTTGTTGVSASFDKKTGELTLVQAEGYDIGIEGFTNSAGGSISVKGSEGNAVSLSGTTNSTRVGGEVTFNSSGPFSVTAGSLFNTSGANYGKLESVADIDISKREDANKAIKIVDGALAYVDDLRADLGAIQNRFSSVVSSNSVTSENVAAARSRVLDADFAAETATARQRSELLARVHDEDRFRVETAFEHLRLIRRQTEVEFRLKEEAVRFVRLVAEPCAEDEDLILGVLVDVTQARRFEAALAHLSHYDELTGIPNRKHFLRAAREILPHATLDRPQLLLYLDVAGLAGINDAYGDRAGDTVLRTLAQRLAHWSTRYGGIACRVGGDEFAALIIPGSESHETEALEELLETLEQPLPLLGRDDRSEELRPRVTIGGVWIPAAGNELEALIRLAQRQQRHALASGRRFSLTAEPSADDAPTVQLEAALHQALARQEFFLLYQPQLELETRRIIGAEALLRWRHPQRGVLPPSSSSRCLEETGLILEAGRWII